MTPTHEIASCVYRVPSTSVEIFRISNHSKLVSNCLERSGLGDSICIDWYSLKNVFSRH